MALSKVDFNSINVTPAASKAIKFNSNNNGLETGDVGGSLVLISEQTASSSSTISFTSGIDSTYKEYVFKFIDIHLSTENGDFIFQGSTNGGSSYGVTLTTTYFQAQQDEAGNNASLQYVTGVDLAQSTSFQKLMRDNSVDNDECNIGTLHLFEPSSTTFVKHFISTTTSITSEGDPRCLNAFIAGYFNTTSAIDAIQFKCTSGNIDAGTIKMYGVT